MRIARSASEIGRESLGTVAFVPTMGAFHEGHLSLMKIARQHGDSVVVSLFVNPLQFGPSEDLSRYPRNEARDAQLAEEAGVDLLYIPGVHEIYPRPSTIVSVPEVTEHWEGKHRQGHFDGVATVVAKLFGIVRPDVALFGLKDLQQCAVIRRMVEDLHLPLKVRFEETVREPDGLAMSSRNAYLSEEERATAPLIYRELRRAGLAIRTEPSTTQSELELSQNALTDAGFAVDYFALVDSLSMQPAQVPSDSSAIVVAARIGKTRLIDNILLANL